MHPQIARELYICIHSLLLSSTYASTICPRALHMQLQFALELYICIHKFALELYIYYKLTCYKLTCYKLTCYKLTCYKLTCYNLHVTNLHVTSLHVTSLHATSLHTTIYIKEVWNSRNYSSLLTTSINTITASKSVVQTKCANQSVLTSNIAYKLKHINNKRLHRNMCTSS